MTRTNTHATRLLIADDSLSFLNVFVLLLKNTGHTVSNVFVGREALAAQHAQPFDLVILNDEIPDLNEVHTLTELRGFFPVSAPVSWTQGKG